MPGQTEGVPAVSTPTVTLAIPAYDEVANIASVVAQARLALEGLSYELLLVDDGSTDGTGAIMDDLARGSDDIRVIHHDVNRGFTGAMSSCFRNANGTWVFLAPADGQVELSEVKHFLDIAASKQADIVVGVRAARVEGMGRKTLSYGFHLIAKTLFALPQEEFSSAFLFKVSLLAAMPFRASPRSAAILPEILFRAKCRKAVIVTQPITQLPRQAGRAKGGQISVAALTLVELLRVATLARWDEARHVRLTTETRR